MQLATDYYGMKGLLEVEDLNAKGEHLAMNVSGKLIARSCVSYSGKTASGMLGW